VDEPVVGVVALLVLYTIAGIFVARPLVKSVSRFVRFVAYGVSCNLISESHDADLPCSSVRRIWHANRPSSIYPFLLSSLWESNV